MSDDKSTPRPWAVVCLGDSDTSEIHSQIQVVHEDGEPGPAGVVSTEIDNSDARLIVTAVNNHDALVSVLTAVLHRASKQWIEKPPEADDAYELLAKIEQEQADAN